MAFEGPTFVFTPRAVREGAPDQSGVYAIFNPAHWVFVGDNDNMRQALFSCLNTPNACINSHEPLSFSCEVASPDERGGRRDALIAELRPICNSPR